MKLKREKMVMSVQTLIRTEVGMDDRCGFPNEEDEVPEHEPVLAYGGQPEEMAYMAHGGCWPQKTGFEGA